MRSIILFDGSNFFYKLKDLGLHENKFDFIAFCEWISGSKKSKIVYYVGAVKQEKGNEKSKILYSKQRSFLANLTNQGIKTELGYIMKSGDAYHEKGVDVKLAMDLITGAYDKEYDKAYLVSSDTDIIPAVKQAIKKNKVVEYIGFSHQPSYALIKNSSSSRLLHKKDLLKYIIK